MRWGGRVSGAGSSAKILIPELYKKGLQFTIILTIIIHRREGGKEGGERERERERER